MGRRGPKCGVCRHRQVETINEVLQNGWPVRSVAGHFGLSKSSMDRHARRTLAGDRTPLNHWSELSKRRSRLEVLIKASRVNSAK
jgi:hypothetical protein